MAHTRNKPGQTKFIIQAYGRDLFKMKSFERDKIEKQLSSMCDTIRLRICFTNRMLKFSLSLRLGRWMKFI